MKERGTTWHKELPGGLKPFGHSGEDTESKYSLPTEPMGQPCMQIFIVLDRIENHATHVFCPPV